MVESRSELNKNLLDRSFQFSVRIVKLCTFLQENHRQLRVISNQLLRSGTSIGANIEEAQGAQTKPDFITKFSISLKESRETSYWLRLLAATELIPEKRLKDILKECEEIKNILGTSIITGKNIRRN